MKLEDLAKNLLSSEASETIDKNSLTKSQKYIVYGGSGLKAGETVVIEPQNVRQDNFDLGQGQKSPKTLCVLATVTSNDGKERGLKMSLSSLTRRSYGVGVTDIPEGSFPAVDVNDIDLILKETDNGFELAQSINAKVNAVKPHIFPVFEKTKDGKMQPKTKNGFVVVAAKATAELVTV